MASTNCSTGHRARMQPEKLMARASICQYKAGSTICLGESPVKYVHLILTSTVSAQNVTYCPRPAHSDDEAVMTIHEMKSRDGNVYTILMVSWTYPSGCWLLPWETSTRGYFSVLLFTSTPLGTYW